MLFELFDEGCFELLGWYETQGPLKASTPNHYLQRQINQRLNKLLIQKNTR